MNVTALNDQVDYLGADGRGFADQTLNSIFNASPRNAVDDDDDDEDEVTPDTDDLDDEDEVTPDTDDLDDDDDLDEDDLDDDDLEAETYTDADELDKIDDSDDAGVIERETNNDDDRGSVSTPFTKSSSFADRPDGRTTGRMIDHEPGSPNNL